MGRVTQISGVGWKAQLPFKDFRGSLCPCQPVSELPPTCLDKGIKRGGERGNGGGVGGGGGRRRRAIGVQGAGLNF